MGWTLLEHELVVRDKISRYLEEASNARRVREAESNHTTARRFLNAESGPGVLRMFVRALQTRATGRRDRDGDVRRAA